MRIKVYISGAIMYATGEDRFAIAEQMLEERGFAAINPKKVSACGARDHECDTLQPHEVLRGMAHSWACFMRYDLLALLRCDAIYMLRGWELSHGARLELNVAAAVGLSVMMED